jgi:hypothetical protein
VEDQSEGGGASVCKYVRLPLRVASPTRGIDRLGEGIGLAYHADAKSSKSKVYGTFVSTRQCTPHPNYSDSPQNRPPTLENGTFLDNLAHRDARIHHAVVGMGLMPVTATLTTCELS